MQLLGCQLKWLLASKSSGLGLLYYLAQESLANSLPMVNPNHSINSIAMQILRFVSEKYLLHKLNFVCNLREQCCNVGTSCPAPAITSQD